MKCVAENQATARRPSPKPAFTATCTFRFFARPRTRVMNEGIGVSGTRISPSGGFSVPVLEEVEAGDDAETAEKHLVRARVVADVAWLPGAVGQIGHFRLAG